MNDNNLVAVIAGCGHDGRQAACETALDTLVWAMPKGEMPHEAL